MGEAKRRGTYEQRKAEGEAKHAEQQRQREVALARREAAMTPEERARRHKARMVLAQTAALGLAATDGMSHQRRLYQDGV